MVNSKKELLKKYIAMLYKKIADGEGLKTIPRIVLVTDKENASKDPIGYTAYYNPEDNSIKLYIIGRLIVDCLRSIGHEFIHQAQRERGDLTGNEDAGAGYAQNNPKLRQLEEEAFLKGSLYLRDLQDELRNKK